MARIPARWISHRGAGEDAARFLVALFEAMVAAADPGRLLPERLPPVPAGRTVVVGAGKAAGAMARTVDAHWRGRLSGLVITRYGHGTSCPRIEVVEAGHPLPDSAGSEAASRILHLVAGLTPDDLVIVLLSGGGSALLTLPAPGLTLADVRETSDRLLRSGAPIGEINCVRKHLSAISGGRLAVAAWPAPVVTFAISDVPGDDPAVIASGPTVVDPSTFSEAREIVARYGLSLPPAVRKHLSDGWDETPKPGDPRLARSRFVLLTTPNEALEVAASSARAAGVEPVVLGAEVQGEARAVAAEHAALVGRLIAGAAHGETVAGSGRAMAARGAASGNLGGPGKWAPLLVLSGGETTVTVRGRGRGGRNTEYLLALALAFAEVAVTRAHSGDLAGVPLIYALAADSDGIDGTEDNAGALLYPDTLARARAAGVDARARLAANDGYGFFAALGDLLVTGPTRTNVNDFRAIFVP